jgi:hypothetical protein
MDLGRAIGFIAGGAAEGYGKGIVEQAKINWERMLKEEDNARADARQAKQQTFESGENTKKIEAEKDIATTHETGANTRTTTEIAGRKDVADIEGQNRKDVANIEAKSRENVAGKELGAVTSVTSDDKGNVYAVTRGGQKIDLGITKDDAKDLVLEPDDRGVLRIINKKDNSSRVVTDESGKPVYGQIKTNPLDSLLGGGGGAAAPAAGPQSAPPRPQSPASAAPGFFGSAAPADDMLGPDATTPAPAAPAPAAPPRYVADPKTGMLAPDGQSAPQKTLSPEEKSTALQNGRSAIAKGADRQKVIDRLKAYGIDTSGL